MFNRVIKKYIDNISKEDIIKFAHQNDISFTDDELNYVYLEVKKNWMHLLNDPTLVINKIQNNITDSDKVVSLYKDYYSKYKNYL